MRMELGFTLTFAYFNSVKIACAVRGLQIYMYEKISDIMGTPRGIKPGPLAWQAILITTVQ